MQSWISFLDKKLSNILCPEHKLPIKFLNTASDAELKDRCWCFSCKIMEPMQIDKAFAKLDALGPMQENLNSKFNTVISQWKNLQETIHTTIELIFQSFFSQLSQLQYKLATIDKFIHYREYISEFTLADLQGVGQLLYQTHQKQEMQNNQTINGENNVGSIFVYQIIKQIKDQGQIARQNLARVFDDLKLLSQDNPVQQNQQNLGAKSRIILNPNNKQPDGQQQNPSNPQQNLHHQKPDNQSRILGPQVKHVYEKKSDYIAQGLINCIVLNQNGSLLIEGLFPHMTTSPNVSIKQIDSLSQIKDLSKFSTGSGEVTCLVYNEDSNIIITGDSNSQIQQWQSSELNNWKLIESFSTHKDSIQSIILSDDKTLMFSASRDKQIKSWTCTNRKLTELQTLNISEDILGVQLSRQKECLVVQVFGALQLWGNQQAWTKTQDLKVADNSKINCFCFVGDNIIVGTEKSTVVTFERNQNQFIQKQHVKDISCGPISQIAFTDGQRQLLIRVRDKIMLYLYTQNNLLMPQQEVFGYYEQAYIQSDQKSSHLLLYKEQDNKVDYYYFRSK